VRNKIGKNERWVQGAEEEKEAEGQKRRKGNNKFVIFSPCTPCPPCEITFVKMSEGFKGLKRPKS